jgi:Tol biopolymer transport system component
MRRFAACVALVLTAALASEGTQPAPPGLDEANLAWDRGDYVAALRAYLALLRRAPDRFHEPIAVQTGELFQTTELTTDGDAPLFSPDGAAFLYEVGRTSLRRTRVVSTAAPTGPPIAELDGSGASFSPDGTRIVYTKIPRTPAILEAEGAIQGTTGAERVRRTAALEALVHDAAIVVVRELQSGDERTIPTGDLRPIETLIAAGDRVLFTAADPLEAVQIYAAETDSPRPLTMGPASKALAGANPAGTAVLFTLRTPGVRRSDRRSHEFGLLILPDRTATIEGSSPSFSADGSSLAYVARTPGGWQLVTAEVADPSKVAVVRAGTERLDAPRFSPDGARLVFQMMPREDWELFTVGRDGKDETRLTREIQHDVLPRFLSKERILATMGEPRHRRSYLYDIETGRRLRFFHNNTTRTIAPEYAWIASPDGTRVLVVAERDGNTVTPDRGVYLVDLNTRVTPAALRARLEGSLEAEVALQESAARAYAPIAATVRRVVQEASIPRVYGYQKALFDFDSKHITRPGNRRAAAYLFEQYASFGYSPEYQWLNVRDALGGATANVLATLRGTVNPELVYVVSSHYDSVENGPGADDDSSGTAALLETARLLARHPQPATIVFASFTAEESGLLGSREFVRRADANGWKVVGALNNDMIGWSNDHRLDSTIRYSNPGIRDLQHGAAIGFTGLITYDALYYRGTDAAAYYERWGDIVGGIGAYPILGNPHYHQAHDVLETVNHRLVTEVAKTTTASLMLLASSPSRLTDLAVSATNDGRTRVSWTASPEAGVTDYLVRWGPARKPDAHQVKVPAPFAIIKAAPGDVVQVKAVNSRGLEGWDWARIVVP